MQASGSVAMCVAVYRTSGTTAAYNLLIPVASGTDDAGPPIDFTFTVVPGSTYWIAVDGVSVETYCNPVTGQCWYTTPTGTFALNLPG